MSTSQRPSLADLNTTRYIVESVPAQIRVVQQKLRELAVARAKYAAELDILIETAVLHGIDLCPVVPEPSSNGNAAGPGGADGVPIRGVA
jgi:hypothetical protein